MKNRYKIFDYMFAHAKYSTDHQESKYIEWDRTEVKESDEYVFFTDYSLNFVQDDSKKNIAWLLESPEITRDSHKWIEENNNRFDIVLTHSKHLLDKGENYNFSPTCGCWIRSNDQKIYNKKKLVSTIASNKNMTYGHSLRHKFIQDYKKNVDVYGRGYNPIDYKLVALQDYSFSVTIENTKKDYYFSEKLIDCFVTGTVPIYWGCPSIGDFFNIDGMIIFDDIVDLKNIMENISTEKYNSMLSAVNDNFQRSKKYLIAEDYIYENYLNKK